jgi:hypothetical protein
MSGTDQFLDCSIPGRLGTYSCASREGAICCANIDNRTQAERAVYHELIHAWDCCRHRLSSCGDRVCSEITAYYRSDCEWQPGRLDCAIDHMRGSLSDTPCRALSQAVGRGEARACLRSWNGD